MHGTNWADQLHTNKQTIRRSHTAVKRDIFKIVPGFEIFHWHMVFNWS